MSVEARNFVEKYGAETLLKFREMIQDGKSNADVARKLGVSRERVRQWRRMFFREITMIELSPAARDAIRR